MKLIVGLGNPGAEYVNTRHNVGFDVVDRLAEKLGWITPGDFDRVAKQKFNGLTFTGVLNRANGTDEKLLLLKPTTFMNVSGRSVQQAMQFFQVDSADLLVILDDLALPCGKLRLKPSGSSGGHNGLRDIEKVLGTNAYPRLRIGIDPAPANIPGRDYVLGRWTETQKQLLTPALDRACGAIISWADYGIDKAMALFNAEDKDSKKETGDRPKGRPNPS
ncbi:MAG TPA: aminoacyl-tRNA hydrolase [Tepidisphaeraceae bacterium]|jgi:PTH1 family peptidyl-tRNA hydrolase